MNRIDKKMAVKVAVSLIAVASLSVAAFGQFSFTITISGQSASASVQFGAASSGASTAPSSGVAISPAGPIKLAAGDFTSVTLTGINKTARTTVKLTEQTPDGVQHSADLSFHHTRGLVGLGFNGNSVGTHVITVWVDNNGNGVVDSGEQASFQLVVTGKAGGSKSACAYAGADINFWTPKAPTPAPPRPPRHP